MNIFDLISLWIKGLDFEISKKNFNIQAKKSPQFIGEILISWAMDM